MESTPPLISECNRLSYRLEHIFHIDAMLACDALSESVRTVFVSEFDQISQLLSAQGLFNQTLARPENIEQLEEALLQHADKGTGEFGWLVKARQPEFLVVGNGEIHYSWAPIRTSWIFAPTYEAAFAAAKDWAEQYWREVWGEDEG